MNCKVIIMLLLTVFLSVLAFSKGKKPHEFSNSDCSICHTEDRPGHDSPADASVTAKCLTCHTDLLSEGYMHPVDIIPKYAKIPADFPLTRDGRITCSTCHDVHTSPETPFGKKSAFLRRMAKGKAFCSICHHDDLIPSNKHQAVFREAHFTSKYIVKTEAVNGIDIMSKNCISCHDGSIGSLVDVRAGSWRHTKNFLKFDKGGMHPIGMRYERTQKSLDSRSSLRPMSMIDKRIRFFGHGQVGCGSCHDPFSQMKNKLVMSNNGSKLCFACHNMD